MKKLVNKIKKSPRNKTLGLFFMWQIYNHYFTYYLSNVLLTSILGFYNTGIVISFPFVS